MLGLHLLQGCTSLITFHVGLVLLVVFVKVSCRPLQTTERVGKGSDVPIQLRLLNRVEYACLRWSVGRRLQTGRHLVAMEQ